MHVATLLLPDLLSDLADGPRHVLLYQFFKVGALPITLLFLLKVSLFVVLLVAVSRLMQRLILKRLFGYLHVSDGAKFALGRFITYLFLATGLFVGLQSLGLNLSSLVVFGGAVGVGVGLGLQNVVSNFVAGLILLIEQPIRMGDRVEMAKTMGDVIKIGARSTWLRTNDNVIIIVPNNEFIQNSVTNWTVNDPNVRISVPVGVGYSSDPAVVREVLLEAAAAHPDVLEDPPPRVLLTDYGDNSVNFVLSIWTATQTHKPAILKSDLYFTLFESFRRHGIELPFPQRDLHVRTWDAPWPPVVTVDPSRSDAR